MTHTERRQRFTLSARYLLSSLAFWIGLAYVVLAFFAGWIYYVGNQTTREQSVRESKAAADVAARKADCLRSIPQIKRINAFLGGVAILANVLEVNSEAIVAATPVSDPQYRVRAANLMRLRFASDKVQGLSFPVPTRAKCEAISS